MITAIIVAVAALIGFAIGVAFHRAGMLGRLREWVRPTAPDLADSYMYRFRVPFLRAFPKMADTVMVGDSIVEMADWSALFPGKSIANHGISGDTTNGVLRRVDLIRATGAKRAFILLGTNDIRQRAPLQVTIDNYRRLIDELRSSRIAVFVQSTLWTDAPAERPLIDALNVALAEACRTNGLTFIDLNATLAPLGQLRPEFSLDGRHLTAAAYAAWRDTIAPLV